MKVLTHIQEENLRVAFWEKIKKYYEKRESYKSFLKYFEKSWLHKHIVEPASNHFEKFERTSNICENFHRHFKNYIGMTHPNLGIFVNKLIEFEGIYKKDLLAQIENSFQKSFDSMSSEQLLPFSVLESYIEKNHKSLMI